MKAVLGMAAVACTLGYFVLLIMHLLHALWRTGSSNDNSKAFTVEKQMNIVLLIEFGSFVDARLLLGVFVVDGGH